MKQEARRYSAKEIEVVPFGVDLSVFFPAPHEHMQKDAFTIGVAKMLEPVYGLDDLVDAFALVHRRNPGAFVRLQIGGTGEQERELRQRTERLEVQNVVDFLGWLDPAGVAALYRRCDLAVFPSRRESFCVSAVEAQACGVPVVATNVGGLPEATLPGKSSLIVQPRDVGALAMAIERLLKDPSLRSRMGVEGRRFVVEHYDIRENFGRLARIYDEVGSVRTRTGF
jgi:glycosyltransferase involved in cell wall biosynthesis